MGYSFGAATALRTAIQHPDLVRRLVVTSFPYRRDGWYPESLAGMDAMGPALAPMLMQSPVYEAYSRVAPRVEDFPVLLDKTGDLLRRDYDWSAEIGRITAPVMLVFADADAVRPAHIVEFYALLGGGLRDANWDGSARPVAGLASCPVTRTTTSSPRRICRPRSSRSWTTRRWNHQLRSGRDLVAARPSAGARRPRTRADCLNSLTSTTIFHICAVDSAFMVDLGSYS
jgi:hypothetical protein